MTEAELDELLVDCPRLFHMAERGSWPSIKRHGLMSTSALLDLFEVEGASRDSIEAAHRPTSVSIQSRNAGEAVVRDQKPMSDNGLQRCLEDGLAPADWYKILNSKVFFWMTEERLHRLLSARAYRELEHDVLVLSSRSLVDEHRDKIWLCPINSGNTKPFPHPRGLNTFRRIEDYPYQQWKRKRRKKGERVVELCVEGFVPDVENHTIEVRRMKGDQIEETIFSAE